MVIIDEKCMLPPPPPYAPPPGVDLNPPPFPSHKVAKTLASLPPHILLYIVHQTLPQTSGEFDGEGKIERQRKTLYWMSIGLRLVNRIFYIACMHVLRSTYLPAYTSLIHKPYSSDPFPMSVPTPTTSTSLPLASPVNALQRETQVLDYFIALKVREDVWADDTELHLERDESFRDLFDLMQPRARTEDLVRVFGEHAGIISVTGCVDSRRRSQSATLPFNALSVSFSPRRVGLVFSSKGGKRTIVDVGRERDDKLEVAAKRLVRELNVWLRDYQ
ncbi:hypothetical protein BD410DRAFT_778146 [Rickenella mellea]|uniref:Uncharacterized protein n=1 Tax=Rickenella mellea TaxID=50990 RepID=A0A4Y7PIT4_9AGAM|nr:hypothetical protein BD410DRAFT_778146 [Rickenella mellea]